MNGPDTLKQYEGPLRTKMGACFPGKRAVFRGQDLHSTFRNANWFDFCVYSITGRHLTEPELNVLQGIWVYTSYPDVRLWNNRVASLAASARSTGAQGLAAGIACSEAAIFGKQPDMAICDFLFRAQKRVAAGECLEDLIREEMKNHKVIMGYGRPMAAVYVDERIPVTFELMKSEGVEMGPHMLLALEIEKQLEKILGRPLPMAYSTPVTAIPLDMGFSVREVYL
ncbi:MAG: citryl-CoA lyase, partial [Burkholderiales bacterium]|nr:citryl-CoA lyase [Burkholderiales bacterium]